MTSQALGDRQAAVVFGDQERIISAFPPPRLNLTEEAAERI